MRNLWIKVILVAVWVALASCATVKDMFQEPKVDFDSMSITGVTLKNTDMEFTFNIFNPNALGVTFSDYEYHLEINDHSFLSGSQPQGIEVPAKGTNQFKIPATVNYSDLASSVQSLVGKSEAPYRLHGSAAVKTPIGAINVPFSHSGTLPLLKKPNVRLASLKIDEISLLNASLLFDIEVENPNILELDIVNFNHNFSISGNSVAESVPSGPMKIRKKGTSTLSIPIQIDFLKLGTTLRSVLNGGSTDYQLGGNIEIKLPGGNLSMPYDHSGSIDLQK
ncbi:MAG: hypothetical protein B6244_07390 [Candidatus Cloacimonetes bacterium 4572_55]|nr:MAG: hypothetical protein B6244_07390 [Candidatus Cloacimonetes bacterium 4572_55]